MNKPRAYLTHATAFDFKTMLYEPLKLSKIVDKWQLILPHATGNAPKNSKEIIKQSDIVLAEVSYPSTGQGIELGWAEMLQKPIVYFYQYGKNYSSSLNILTDKFFIYRDTTDLIHQLELKLKETFTDDDQHSKSY